MEIDWPRSFTVGNQGIVGVGDLVGLIVFVGLCLNHV